MSKGLKRLNDSGRMDIPEILFNIPGTIVDWDIYDDATSPDGGAWRKKTAHTSWYNEPLNTATRGSKREFPARALVTAEAAKVTIWDITSGQPGMWMVFESAAGGYLPSTMSSVSILNNILVLGSNTGTVGGLSVINFIADTSYFHYSGNYYGQQSGNIAARATSAYIYHNGMVFSQVVGFSYLGVNSVAITYLDDAPLDEYGMRVPTIVVGTNGGVSVIKHDGSVVNITFTAYSVISAVMFTGTGGIAYTTDASTGGRWLHVDNVIPTSNLAKAVGYVGTASDQMYHTVPGNVYAGTSLYLLPSNNIAAIVNNAASGSLGVSLLHRNPTTPANGMVAYLTNTYNTGWMVGDIRRAYLCNSLTVDRSVKGGALTTNGTVTETVNAGGVNVYSGFSATNYLSEPSHVDWNALGTGDFSISMSGVKWGTSGQYRGLVAIGGAVTVGGFGLVMESTNKLGIWQYTSYYQNFSNTTIAYTDLDFHSIVVARTNGIVTIYVDSVLVLTYPFARDISTTSDLMIGNGIGPWMGGQVSQIRISATAPTPEQIKHMYETERKMFETGAQALLSSSPSVSDLRYDKTTDLYAVTNGTNTDVFKDLTRIDSAATGSKLNAPITTMSGNALIAPAENIASSIRAIGVKQPKTVLLDFNVVVNGKFSTASGWTLTSGATIVNGVLNTNGANGLAAISSGLVKPHTLYEISFNILSLTSGYIILDVGGRNTGTSYTSGVFTQSITSSTQTTIAFNMGTAVGGQIDNLSIRESTNTLPQGFKPKKVWAGGLLQEEGTDYDVTFDGFLYGINFFIEPATNVQVEGEYI